MGNNRCKNKRQLNAKDTNEMCLRTTKTAKTKALDVFIISRCLSWSLVGLNLSLLLFPKDFPGFERLQSPAVSAHPLQ